MQKLIKTIKCRVDAAAAELLPTIRAYTESFNQICLIGYEQKIASRVKLQKLTYHNVKAKTELPSQLTCSSIFKAADALKRTLREEKKKKDKYSKCPVSKQQSIRYDVRSYTIFLDRKEVTLSTLDGRKRYKLVLSPYHQQYFQGWKHTSADLVVRKNKVFLHIVFEKYVEEVPTNGTFVGMDRGISNIAVLSNNTFYSGNKVKEVSQRYKNLRRKLQRKGTKSAKRHLCRISAKERRFRADVNHQISKEVIGSLKAGDTLVLEDLTGIRNKKMWKPVRVLVHGWSFFQLEQFLIYKAAAAGIHIEKVSAYYTSQTCSRCGYCAKNNRKTRSDFCCQQCLFKLNADLNASRNIRNKASGSYTLPDGAEVNQPIVGAEKLLTSPQLSAEGN